MNFEYRQCKAGVPSNALLTIIRPRLLHHLLPSQVVVCGVVEVDLKLPVSAMQILSVGDALRYCKVTCCVA